MTFVWVLTQLRINTLVSLSTKNVILNPSYYKHSWCVIFNIFQIDLDTLKTCFEILYFLKLLWLLSKVMKIN